MSRVALALLGGLAALGIAWRAAGAGALAPVTPCGDPGQNP